VTQPSPTKSSADLVESYPTIVGLLDVQRAASYGTKRATDGAGVVRTSSNFQGVFPTPPCGPGFLWRDSTVQLCSSELPSKVRSRAMLQQHRMNCGRPTDQKPLAGYITGVRVTTSMGATWITPGNHLWAYFDLRVVVWLTVEGLALTGEAARLP